MSKAMIAALKTAEVEDGVIRMSDQFRDMIVSELETLELLKGQESRILDLDELENWDNAVWFEEKDEQDCYIALTANVGTYDATFVNVEPGKFHRLVFLREFYRKEWRCWSARPTEEQRKAVKWDE